MKKLQLFLLISMLNIAYTEDLGMTNLDYQKSRIKSKAKKSNRKGDTCYKYIEVRNNREWNRKKDELNTYIHNNQDKCKKYIIYNEIRNVNTQGFFNSSAKNNNKGEYDINLGVILEDNPNVDIEVYTVVKNSHIKENGFSEIKANIGSIIVENDDEDIEIENRKLKAVSKIDNSEVGQLNMATQYGLDKVGEFMKRDKDDPFN